MRSLYQRKWSKQRIIDLFSVIDWMMHLPEELENKLWQDIIILEEKETMRYVTSIERIYLKKGKQEGEMLIFQRLLARRFGVLPSETISLISNAPVENIERWVDRVLDAETLTDVFKD